MASAPRTKKKYPKSVKDMSKEMLQETLKKKKECNSKALQIVEKLCDDYVEEEYLLANLEFINQSHFEDIVIERAISKICGYPVCSKKIEKVLQQKYHISTRYNKVFDITDRKNFCSSVCFKAAMFLKEQLLTSPLWFRDQEIIPKFKLLKSFSSSLGDHVIFTEESKVDNHSNVSTSASQSDKKEKLAKTKRENVTPGKENRDKIFFYNKKEVESKVIVNSSHNQEENSCGSNTMINDIIKNMDISIKEENEKNSDSDDEDKSFKKGEEKGELPSQTSLNVEISRTKSEEEMKSNSTTEKSSQKKDNKNSFDSISLVEKCISEWFSLDTMLFLYGEEKVKVLFNDKTNEIMEIIKNRRPIPRFSEKMEKFIHLFSLLDPNAMNEEVKELKPLPDYSILQEEGRNLEVKVRAFYHGQLEVEKNMKDNSFRKEETKAESGSEIILPLIDSQAQNCLRRKIVLDRLDRVIPELVKTFTQQSAVEMSEVRDLVSNFTLSAHNITFKPTEWYLMGIIIIKLLSLKNLRLQTLLSSVTSRKHLNLFLMSYQLEFDYLDNIVEWLTNSENVLQKLKIHAQ